MNESQDKLMREIYRLTKENNKMIHKLDRDAKRSRMWKMIRLFITVGLLFGAYYFVQPLIENLASAYDSIQQSFEELQDTKNLFSTNVNSLFGGLKNDTE